MANPLADPYQLYTIRVKVSGIDDDQFYFTKCSPFSVTVGTNEYRNQENDPFTHNIPTQVKYDPITLSYGMTKSRALFDWLMKAAAGTVERKNVAIQIMSDDGSSTKELWELVNAWPQKWEGYEVDATSNEMAIAQLTLVYEQLNRK